MTERELTPLWSNIFNDISEEVYIFADLKSDSVHYQMGEVNFYQLTSHLEELYLLNSELRDRIEQLEKDNELLKSYAWEQ